MDDPRDNDSQSVEEQKVSQHELRLEDSPDTH